MKYSLMGTSKDHSAFFTSFVSISFHIIKYDPKYVDMDQQNLTFGRSRNLFLLFFKEKAKHT